MAKTYRRFRTEFKLGVVEAYLAGEGSLKGLATKAGVDHSLVHYWLKKYHAGELSLDLLREEESVETAQHIAALIERHWDGIAAYRQPENKVALGFIEGLNSKIRVIQRRCYGLRDEESLRLKILTCTLPHCRAIKTRRNHPRDSTKSLFMLDRLSSDVLST